MSFLGFNSLCCDLGRVPLPLWALILSSVKSGQLELLQCDIGKINGETREAVRGHLIHVGLAPLSSEAFGGRVSFSGGTSLTQMQV